MKTKLKPGQGYAMTRKVIEGVMYPPDRPAARTKIIPVWHVEWAYKDEPHVELHTSYEWAEHNAKWRSEMGYIAVTITGPHDRRVGTESAA